MKDKKKCIIWWCGKPHYAHEYCITHYRAVNRYGSPYGLKSASHYRQYTAIDEMTQKARIVAKALLDSLGLLGPECPYCHKLGEHKPDCPVYDAQNILERTK